ncbi:hypothetical protein KRX52_04390 [Pseudomonas sp. MAP12]|uniref:Uncharacterized protein n=1 Tax=Geopseudomonas aromaticivorans TaxID=2849492 RepID=A0ABS6MT98_9GAMM|nr:hypothetical protein [Pseudomonas aromaticivorans]MBV2132035.1 hypothetical protein [Pseudomonas aromaticivorans]
MQKTVQFKIGDTTHSFELNGSVPASDLELKKLIANHIDAPGVDYSRDCPRPSIERQVDDRLKFAGVTDFKIL